MDRPQAVTERATLTSRQMGGKFRLYDYFGDVR